MNDAPKLRCFSSQLVSDWQFAPESPPKLYPRYGVTNPSALAGTAAAASAARVNAASLYRTNSLRAHDRTGRATDGPSVARFADVHGTAHSLGAPPPLRSEARSHPPVDCAARRSIQ